MRKPSCSQGKEGAAWKMWPWDIVVEVDESAVGHRLWICLFQAIWPSSVLCLWTPVCALGALGTSWACVSGVGVSISAVCISGDFWMQSLICLFIHVTYLQGSLHFLFGQRHHSCWCFFLILKTHLHALCWVRFSCVQLFATLWTVAPRLLYLSMGFSRQEYWNGLPYPPPEDLPNLGIKPTSLMTLHWQVGSLPLVLPGTCSCLKGNSIGTESVDKKLNPYTQW